MQMQLIDELIGLLKCIKNGCAGWEDAFVDLKNKLYRGYFSDLPEDVRDILNELYHDLHFYVANPEWRKEDPSYYGQEGLKQHVISALGKLRQLGVEIPD
jgi:hypothetical protein